MRGLIERNIQEDVTIHDIVNHVLDSKYFKTIKVFGIVIYRHDYKVTNVDADKTTNTII